MSFLDVQDVGVRYGQVQAVRSCSLAVERGGALGIFGLNGAGKSSLLRAIAGDQRCSGRVIFDGTDMSRWPAERRVRSGLALVPEGHPVFPALTVYENLRLGGFRLSRDEFATAADRVCELFQVLGERKSELAGNLSGGQQQMLALARSLISEPELLMLDEPSLGLAPGVINEVYARLRDLREQGVTLIIVEQQVRRALDFVDDAVILHQGEIVMRGTARELADDGKLFAVYSGVADGAIGARADQETPSRTP